MIQNIANIFIISIKKNLGNYFLFRIYDSRYIVSTTAIVEVVIYDMLQEAYDQLKEE